MLGLFAQVLCWEPPGSRRGWVQARERPGPGARLPARCAGTSAVHGAGFTSGKLARPWVPGAAWGGAGGDGGGGVDSRGQRTSGWGAC